MFESIARWIAATPLVELSIFTPLLGAVWIATAAKPNVARRRSMILTSIVLILVTILWMDTKIRPDGIVPAQLLSNWLGSQLFQADSLNAPQIVLAGLIHFLTPLMTIRSKMARFSFAGAAVGQFVTIATFACMDVILLAAFLTLSVLVPVYEIKARGGSPRVFLLHMLTFIVLLWIGVGCISIEPTIASIALALAISIRLGLPPFHLWVGDLLEQATFGRCILFLLPMPAIYLACRVLIPGAPHTVLTLLGILALFGAFYSAGMSLVQSGVRRFFAYFYIGQAAFILVGMESISPLGLTGALTVWLTGGFGLAGVGLTLRALEVRHGTLTLTRHAGLQSLSPVLAPGFVISALACIGFPGTLGFVGLEILLDATVQSYSLLGVTVVVALAIFGISTLRAYFALFTGKPNPMWLPALANVRERLGVDIFALLLIVGGVLPQAVIDAKFHAATQILNHRQAIVGSATQESSTPGQPSMISDLSTPPPPGRASSNSS